MQTIAALELKKYIDEGKVHACSIGNVLHEKTENAILVDVRTPAEFAEAHIEGAMNISLDNFNGNEICLKNAGKIFLICKGGVRAGRACAKVDPELLHKVFVLEGGLDEWIKNGFAAVKNQKNKLSLMQQTHLAIGSGVAATSLLSLSGLHFMSLFSLFFGCGLIFAGLSGFCPLLTLISKMPWNKN